MDNLDARRSSKQEIMDAEGGVKWDEERQALLNAPTKSEHLKSNSISSDVSSEGDFFQLDPTTLAKPISCEQSNSMSAALEKILGATDHTHQAAVVPQLTQEGGEVAGHGKPLPGAEAADKGSSTPLVVNQTPLTQQAVHIEGYDPDRIPAFIFTPKSVRPADWSICSNESLFSIQMGNASFSREHGLQIARSGELGNFSYSPGEPEHADSPLPLSSNPGDVILDAANDAHQAAATEAVNAQAMEDVLRAATGEHNGTHSPLADGLPSSASVLRHSDASSIHSFAFPILTGPTVSLKIVPEPQSQWEHRPAQVVGMETRRIVRKTPPPHQNKWFQCFSCTMCRAD